ncbi:MAG: hypothetical protein JNG89_15320 [Planctomycetaceae bacterium]|nr:hypothetical protein [Planctomycetaceae bacterium]
MPSSPAESELVGDVRWRRVGDRMKMHAKQRALVWMLIWAAVAGFATGSRVTWELFGCLPQLVAVLAFVSLTYRWCDADAKLHRFVHWDTFVPALYVCPGPLVVVPVYLAATRRTQRLRSLSLGALYLFVLAATAILMSGIGTALA